MHVCVCKGPGKRGHIVAETLLPTQMFPRLPTRATFVADTNFVSGTQKMFLILFRNILCQQQMFPSLRSMETQHSFCVPRVCAPKKHHEQQCVLVCQYLNVRKSQEKNLQWKLDNVISMHEIVGLNFILTYI